MQSEGFGWGLFREDFLCDFAIDAERGGEGEVVKRCDLRKARACCVGGEWRTARMLDRMEHYSARISSAISR